MAYSFLLTAHIVGAAVTGVVASYAGVVMWQRASGSYRTCALTLGILAAYQILSGVVLAFISSTISAPSLCANIAVYLSVVAFVETLLFINMRKASVSFPTIQTISPVVASLLLLAAAAAYGF